MTRLIVISLLVSSQIASASGPGELLGGEARRRTKKAKRSRDELRQGISNTQRAIADTQLAVQAAEDQARSLRERFVAWRDAVRQNLPGEIARQTNILQRETKLIADLQKQLDRSRAVEASFEQFADLAGETVQNAKAALSFASYARQSGHPPLLATEASLTPLVKTVPLEVISENNVRVHAMRASLELQLERATRIRATAAQAINLYRELRAHLGAK